MCNLYSRRSPIDASMFLQTTSEYLFHKSLNVSDMLLVSLTRLVDELTMRVLIGEGDADSSGAPTPSLIELNFCIDRVHPSCSPHVGTIIWEIF